MQTIENVAAIRAKLCDAGFRPVSVITNDKQPIGKDWAEKARHDPPPAVAFNPVPHALNTGILCDGLRAIDLDIDDKEIAARCRAIVMQRFGEAPIRMRRNSSRCLILYRAATGEPRKLVLAGELGKVEVLGRGQQFVAFGGHPSGAVLEWFPDAPGTEPLSALPAITESDLIDTLAELAPIIKAPSVPGQDTERQSSTPEACPLRIATALNSIPNNGPADWEAWNRVGMATWRATGGSEIGWQAFDAWSQRHPAYDATETRKRWDHYRTSPPTQIGAGTLFHMAEQTKPKEQPTSLPTDLLSLTYVEDIHANLDIADFIEDLLIKATMAVVYGESNCGKTFLMTDLALHVALGKAWRGKEVEQCGVIYCALEGKHGISNRVAAFKQFYGLEGQRFPFAIVTSSVNLLNPEADTERLIASIKDAKELMGIPVSLVVIDTLSRALAGGNENASEDMGALVVNADKVRHATEAALVFVHHSGKDAAKGARGHSLLRAATDTEIEVSRTSKGAPSLAEVVKQRDLPIEGRFWFQLESVVLGKNRRGKDVTSCVVLEHDGAGQPDKAGQHRLSDGHSIVMRALTAAISRGGALLPPTGDYPRNTVAVSTAVWREEFYQSQDGTQVAKSKAFKRGQDALLARNIITIRNGLVWLVKADNQTDKNGQQRTKADKTGGQKRTGHI